MAVLRNDFPQAPLPHATSDVAWNEMRKALLELQQYVADNLGATDGSNGGTPYIHDVFLATIRSAGPGFLAKDYSANYTDARYWVTRAVPDPTNATYMLGGGGTDVLQVEADPLNSANGKPYWVTATNLSELPVPWSYARPAPTDNPNPTPAQGGTHLLAAGTTVLVIAFADPIFQTRQWYVFVSGGGGSVTTGQYQYMSYQMTAQNQAGWDFVRAHPLI